MTLESGHAERRGLNASWPQVGVPIGLLLANGVLSLMGAVTDEAAFPSWGWRVPFLLSGLPAPETSRIDLHADPVDERAGTRRAR